MEALQLRLPSNDFVTDDDEDEHDDDYEDNFHKIQHQISFSKGNQLSKTKNSKGAHTA